MINAQLINNCVTKPIKLDLDSLNLQFIVEET